MDCDIGSGPLEVDCIYTVYKVTHSRLINKIQNHGIKNPILDWIQDFLKGMFQRVSIKGKLSIERKVTREPLLFIL